MRTASYIVRTVLLPAAILCAAGARAESTIGSGRGGIYVNYHLRPLSSFDPLLTGNAMVVGGKGAGVVAKNFRLGGAGGGGFAWGGGSDVSYGMGYGGVLGEYSITPWFNASLIVGGGGFSVGRVVASTSTTTTTQKIASGGFLLFYPEVHAEVKLRSLLTLQFNFGYFLPTDAALQSMTLGVSLVIGKI